MGFLTFMRQRYTPIANGCQQQRAKNIFFLFNRLCVTIRQSGISEVWQRARPGSERSQVRILDPRPILMSKGKLGKARFCPWCGTDSLVRDTFSGDTQAEHTHVSYVCAVCCTGFSLRNSPRAMFVNRMYALDRKQRPPEKPNRGGGGHPPLSEKPLTELVRVEALLAAKSPHGRVNRESVNASLAAVRSAIQERL